MIKTITVNGKQFRLPANTKGYYSLWYDAVTKKIRSCTFVWGETTAPATLEGYATWPEVQARASDLKLTGLRDDPKPSA